MKSKLTAYNPLLKLTALLALLALLIIYPDACITGARFGLVLWFNTLLPTLFPFFLITRLIIVLKLCPQKFHAVYPVLVGLIAGYPTGALTCSEMNIRGYIPDNIAQCMLIICNNISPVFLINYVACLCLGIPESRFVIWFSVICASAITSFTVYMLKYRTHTESVSCFNSTPKNGTHLHSGIRYNTDNTDTSSIFEPTMMKVFEILVKIGGYVVIFSIMANLLIQLPVSKLCASIIAGILEVTTGCGLICDCPADVPLHIKSAAAAALCGFGGISGIMQTKSALYGSSLSITHYTFHKFICGLLSFLICYILI